jgi:hypothetical protein
MAMIADQDADLPELGAVKGIEPSLSAWEIGIRHGA